MEIVGQQLNKSLITGYNGDGSYAGASVNGKYDGEVSGDVTLVSGVKGYALEFSPGCGQIKVDSLANYYWGSKFTVSLYIMRFNKAVNQSVISNGYCTTGSFEIKCGSLSYLMYGGTVNTKGDSSCWDTGKLYLQRENTWYHLAMTYDGATLKMYLDGSLVSTSKNNKGALKQSPYSLLIGQIQNSRGYDECFNGRLDEIFLYSEVASQSDVVGLACFQNYKQNQTNTSGTNPNTNGTNTNTSGTKTNTGTNSNTGSPSTNGTSGTSNPKECLGNAFYDYDRQRCATCYMKDCLKCLGPNTCLYCQEKRQAIITEESLETNFEIFSMYSNLSYNIKGKYYMNSAYCVTDTTKNGQIKHVDIIVLFWLVLLASVIL